MSRIPRWSLALLLASAAACSSTDPAPATIPDAAPDVTAEVDAGVDTGVEAGRDPNDILGTITGACPLTASHVREAGPSVVKNTLAFTASESWSRANLSPGGQRVFDSPNAGGSSIESEVMTFEMLHFCDGATLLKTEKEIVYDDPPEGGAATITDLLVNIGGDKVGVNPVRPYKPGGMNDAEVKTVVENKLASIVASSARVSTGDKWVKQIMHVWCFNQACVDSFDRVYPTIPEATRANTIVLVTKTEGGGFLYCNPDPPLGSECP
jgi:hypothetical protein